MRLADERISATELATGPDPGLDQPMPTRGDTGNAIVDAMAVDLHNRTLNGATLLSATNLSLIASS